MTEFRIRVEFDVEVDGPSHIDAAWAAAEWLREIARANRFDYLTYEVAEHSVMHDGTQWNDVDLEEIQSLSDEDPVDLAGYVTTMETYPDNHAFHRDGQPCVRATALRDCPENHRYGRTFEEAH